MLRLQCSYSFTKSTIQVFSVQAAWYSPNTLPTMVHDKIFRITWHLKGLSLSGSHWATMWVWELRTLSSTQYIIKSCARYTYKISNIIFFYVWSNFTIILFFQNIQHQSCMSVLCITTFYMLTFQTTNQYRRWWTHTQP